MPFPPCQSGKSSLILPSPKLRVTTSVRMPQGEVYLVLNCIYNPSYLALCVIIFLFICLPY